MLIDCKTDATVAINLHSGLNGEPPNPTMEMIKKNLNGNLLLSIDCEYILMHASQDIGNTN